MALKKAFVGQEAGQYCRQAHQPININLLGSTANTILLKSASMQNFITQQTTPTLGLAGHQKSSLPACGLLKASHVNAKGLSKLLLEVVSCTRPAHASPNDCNLVLALAMALKIEAECIGNGNKMKSLQCHSQLFIALHDHGLSTSAVLQVHTSKS